MPALNPTRQNVLLLAVLLFAQLLLLAGSDRGVQGSNFLETGVMRLTGPVVHLASAIGGTLRGSVTGLRQILSARSENAALRDELDRVRTELKRYRENAAENQRLRLLLGMRENVAPQSIAAKVVTAVLTDRDKMIVIDRGTADGVHPDLPVIAWGGAVGRVVSAGPAQAKVRLLTDLNSGVAGVIQRTRVAGMVQGMGDGPMEMLYVPQFSDVMLGDRVVTSGLDGVFPAGIGIGSVEFVGDDSSVSKPVRLQPETDFTTMEEVLVLLEPVAGPVLDTDPGEIR